MSRYTRLLLAAVALLLIQHGSCGEIQVPEEEVPLAIDIVSSEGVELKIPFMPNLVETWSKEKRAYHSDGMGPIFDYLIKTSDEILKTKVGFLTWGKILADLSKMAKNSPKKEINPALAANPGTEFEVATFKLVDYVLQRSAEIEAEKKANKAPKDNGELLLQSHAFLQTLREGLGQSPVVSFVDWTRGTVNGEEFPEYSAKFLASLRYNGYGSVAWIAQKILAIVKVFL